MRVQKPDWVYLGGAIITLAVFLGALEYAVPNFFLQDDNAVQNLPWFTYNWRAVIENQEIPFITFHQYMGQEYLGEGQNGVFYIPAYIGVGLSKALFHTELHAIEIMVFIHTCIAAVGMFLLLRYLGISPPMSALATVLWLTFPYNITIPKAQINKIYFLAYLPFNFLYLEKLFAQPKPRYAAGTAIAKLLLLFGGHAQSFLILLQCELVYIIIRLTNLTKKRGRAALKQFLIPYLASLAATVASAAPLLGPMIYKQQLSLSRSQPLPKTEFLKYAMRWRDFAAAQLYSFRPRALVLAQSHIYYIGAHTILPFLFLYSKKIRRQAYKHKTLACLTIATVTLLASTKFIGVLYGIPVLEYFRGAHRYFLPFLFFYTLSLAGTLNATTHHIYPQLRHIMNGVLVVAIALNMTIIWQQRGNAPSYFRLDHQPSKTVAALINKDEGRILTFNILTNKNPDLCRYMGGNCATLFDKFHFGGYDPLVSLLNARLSWGLQGTNSLYEKLDDAKLNYLSTWSIKYILTEDNETNRAQFTQFPQVKLIREEDNLLLYENTQSRPYVYNASNPIDAIPFSFGINHIDIFPNNTATQAITINVTPLRQFYYYIDDKKVDHIPISNKPITLNIPANTKKVTLRYIDYSFRWGIILAISFWTVAGITVIMERMKKSHNQTDLNI